MSAPFTFRLERVRSLREREEDLAREAMTAGLLQQREGELALTTATGAVDGARRHARSFSTAPGGASPADLMAAQVWLERTERSAREAELDLDRRTTEVEARRTALAAAARDREAIERLKTRRRADWERDTARREAIELDEIALTTHRRGRAA